MTDPRTPRRQLGRVLRQARVEAGLTQSQVARELGCGQAKINKIETTLVRVSPGELDKMIEIYGISPERADELRAIVDQDSQLRRRGAPPSWQAFGEFSDLEADASEILCWHSERIPGPLQSEHYMLHQFRATTESASDVTELMRLRRARTRIFRMEDPPHYRAILSESSLRRVPSGRFELVVDQVEHLLALTRRYDRLTLQILPFNADIPYVDTDFEILHFAGSQPSLAYVEGPGGARIYRSRQDLAGFTKHWGELHAAALSPRDSREFLEKLAKKSLSEWRATHND